jgi:hypothetical protein
MGAHVTHSELLVLCKVAGIDVPVEDLPALAQAFANLRAGAEQLRRVELAKIDPPESLDPKWT